MRKKGMPVLVWMLVTMFTCLSCTSQQSEPPQPTVMLRTQAEVNLKDAVVKSMLVEKDMYDALLNPAGKGIVNQFMAKTIGADRVIADLSTGLTWQQSGSNGWMSYRAVPAYLATLNKNRFAGYADWRLPTLAEAMSLMTPKASGQSLYIDGIFDDVQYWIYTADMDSLIGAWRVDFYGGSCHPYAVHDGYYVRAVRSGLIN